MTITDNIKDRFWLKVEKADGCWNWIARLSVHGYGEFDVGEKSFRAHRVSWTMEHGDIPPGMCVCHHCDNRKCVRPDHLFLGTNYDNQQDMKQKGRGIRILCRRGHELKVGNVNYRSNKRGTYRVCKICERAKWLRKYYVSKYNGAVLSGILAEPEEG